MVKEGKKEFQKSNKKPKTKHPPTHPPPLFPKTKIIQSTKPKLKPKIPKQILTNRKEKKKTVVIFIPVLAFTTKILF